MLKQLNLIYENTGLIDGSKKNGAGSYTAPQINR